MTGIELIGVSGWANHHYDFKGYYNGKVEHFSVIYWGQTVLINYLVTLTPLMPDIVEWCVNRWPKADIEVMHG